MMVAMYLLLLASLLVDIPSLIRRGEKRVLVLYISIFAVGTALAVIQSLGIKIPSPLGTVADYFINQGFGYPT